MPLSLYCTVIRWLIDEHEPLDHVDNSIPATLNRQRIFQYPMSARVNVFAYKIEKSHSKILASHGHKMEYGQTDTNLS